MEFYLYIVSTCFLLLVVRALLLVVRPGAPSSFTSFFPEAPGAQLPTWSQVLEDVTTSGDDGGTNIVFLVQTKRTVNMLLLVRHLFLVASLLLLVGHLLLLAWHLLLVASCYY